MEEGQGKGSEELVFKRRAYVRVVDTTSEWEGLIGVIDEFTRPDKTTTKRYESGYQVIVFFPLDRENQRLQRLIGVNTFPSSCRQHLKLNDDLQIFEDFDLELVHPDELS